MLFQMIAVFCILTLLIAIVFYQSHVTSALMLAAVFSIVAFLVYTQLGFFPELLQQEKHSKLLAEFKLDQDPNIIHSIIMRLKAIIAKKPEDPQGWYLLGKMYVKNEQWSQAEVAYKKAYDLKPDSDEYFLNYIETEKQLHRAVRSEDNARFKKVKQSVD